MWFTVYFLLSVFPIPQLALQILMRGTYRLAGSLESHWWCLDKLQGSDCLHKAEPAEGKEGQLAIRMVRTWWRKKRKEGKEKGKKGEEGKKGIGNKSKLLNSKLLCLLCWETMDGLADWTWKARLDDLLMALNENLPVFAIPDDVPIHKATEKCMKMRGASYGVSRRPEMSWITAVTIYDLSAQTNFESVKTSISYEDYGIYIYLCSHYSDTVYHKYIIDTTVYHHIHIYIYMTW